MTTAAAIIAIPKAMRIVASRSSPALSGTDPSFSIMASALAGSRSTIRRAVLCMIAVPASRTRWMKLSASAETIAIITIISVAGMSNSSMFLELRQRVEGRWMSCFRENISVLDLPAALQQPIAGRPQDHVQHQQADRTDPQGRIARLVAEKAGPEPRDDIEERVQMADLLEGRSELIDRVEGSAQERQGR